MGAVIVLGAGPVGLATALKRARAGIKVVVLGAEAKLFRWPRTVVHRSATVEELMMMTNKLRSPSSV